MTDSSSLDAKFSARQLLDELEKINNDLSNSLDLDNLGRPVFTQNEPKQHKLTQNKASQYKQDLIFTEHPEPDPAPEQEQAQVAEASTNPDYDTRSTQNIMLAIANNKRNFAYDRTVVEEFIDALCEEAEALAELYFTEDKERNEEENDKPLTDEIIEGAIEKLASFNLDLLCKYLEPEKKDSKQASEAS